ncbi:ribokinase [Paracoccus marinaquae]|uniref:Ribokinase n=1 Tax=Paracoccus marinaquae TaxID=2841926 RepID=A0ABS6AGR1_9RHOB|nr:ribokinase [Paracoccus marinaquae]MBU3028824.1 ribokinase [Paracoccus marinaquae]
MAIWNLGSINIDHVYRLDHLPRPGETIAARHHSVGLGGKGANQSVAAARAGAEVRHIGAMGPGDDWVIERLRDAGVGTADLQRRPDLATGHAIILVDGAGENSIVIHAGANRAIDEADLSRTLGRITGRDLLLIQNETNCQVEAARIARAAGARVLYSAAPFEIAALRQVLPHASILAMNEGEAEQLFREIPGELPVEGLLVTRGSKGAEYRDLRTGQIDRQPAFPVQAVDTTGAGDTFAGYFAAALDRRETVPEALHMASAAAALKVTRKGAGDAIPDRAEVLDFLGRRPARPQPRA